MGCEAKLESVQLEAEEDTCFLLIRTTLRTELLTISGRLTRSIIPTDTEASILRTPTRHQE